MVFSSVIFLFVFLPITLAIYFLLPQWRALRNGFLLVVSLLFYAWGEMGYVAVMLVSIGWNYAAAVLIEDVRGRPSYLVVLWFGIVGNVALLAYYKYANFLVDNAVAALGDAQRLLGHAPLPPMHLAPVHLPLGISFFTFHAISYLIDVHRNKVAAQRNLLDLALYISLFPQLVAGPVVRYRDVATQITEPRRITVPDLAEGVQRFIIGLGKKVLLANPLGQTANNIFALDHHTALNASIAWLGLVCYTLQIYCDFSGYSDMAIGLGRMFGFRFLENFNYPYISKSLGEFWRRWHISLSTWFRDYVYIPLGGNRVGFSRNLFNLMVVFLLCGLWHGASWTFVAWGLWHGAFLIAERLGLERLLTRVPAVVSHGYALLVIMLGWVLFREDSFGGALLYARALFGGAPAPVELAAGVHNELPFYLDPGLLAAAAAAAVASLPWVPLLRRWRASRAERIEPPAPSWRESLFAGAGAVALLAVFVGSILSLASGVYNPFIYFRF